MTMTSQNGGTALDQARLRLSERCAKRVVNAAAVCKSALTPRARRTRTPLRDTETQVCTRCWKVRWNQRFLAS